MKIVDVSAAERRAGKLSAAACEEARLAVYDEGFVALVGAVSESACDRVYQQLVAEYEWLQATFGPFPVRGSGGYEGARYHGHTPATAEPPLSREITCNPFAIQVSIALMGKSVHVEDFGANWSLPPRPGEEPARQGVHGDAGPLFPYHGWTPPFILNLSIPIVDFTEQNGATEIWRYTHKLDPAIQEHPSNDARLAAIEAQRAVCPPERMVAPKGTVVLRDPRAWHAGMPNLTTKPRIMLAMRHFIFWMRNCNQAVKGTHKFPERTLKVVKGSESCFQDNDLDWRLDPVPADPYQHLYDGLLKGPWNDKPEQLPRALFDEKVRQSPPPSILVPA